MNLPTMGQASAAGRHVLSYAMGAVTAAVALHVLSGDQGSSVTGAIQQIVSGIYSITGGLATLISVGSAVWAAWTASPRSQLLAAASNPQVSKIVAPGIADSVPSDKVVKS